MLENEETRRRIHFYEGKEKEGRKIEEGGGDGLNASRTRDYTLVLLKLRW